MSKSIRGVCTLQVGWPPPGSGLSPLRCPHWDAQQRTHWGCYMGSATRGEERWRKSRPERPLRWAVETSIFFYLRQNNIFSYWKSEPWWLQEKEEKIHKNRKKWEHLSPDVWQIGRKRRDSHDPSPTPQLPHFSSHVSLQHTHRYTDTHFPINSWLVWLRVQSPEEWGHPQDMRVPVQSLHPSPVPPGSAAVLHTGRGRDLRKKTNVCYPILALTPPFWKRATVSLHFCLWAFL